MKIFHHNDLDGRCAAAIVLNWCEQKGEKAFCVEMDYKDSPAYHLIAKDEIVEIVDFSFKPDVMEKILEITENVFWIDHHVSARDYPYQNLGGLRDFSDKGQSGCELTWKYHFPYHTIPLAVKLIGDYDKWALKYQPDCFEFYEGLKVQKDTSPSSELWKRLFCKIEKSAYDNVQLIKQHGRISMTYRDNYCEKICKEFGYEIEWEGHKAFITNFYQFGSKGFGDRMEQYDFCVAYIHDGNRFTVSLYSTKDVDVSIICKKHGGGGHKGAAGFVCKELPWSASL